MEILLSLLSVGLMLSVLVMVVGAVLCLSLLMIVVEKPDHG